MNGVLLYAKKKEKQIVYFKIVSTKCLVDFQMMFCTLNLAD